MWARLAPIMCLSIIVIVIAGLPIAGAVADAPRTGQAAVLFSPLSTRVDQMQAAAQAGVTIVRFGALPGTVIVQMDTPSATHLRSAGAWVIADPIILGGCAPRIRSKQDGTSS